ncbi:Rab effector MyRIP [Paragonimus heterotremus]|uniref:Rab effector MyRIP n=1 Tax=Paragonimus heterotremus TaxID=100268 RepID=A0A8J4TCV6_9TREM|nr:Rab effector MyRIP [Paragonimus heterotremus]
MEPQNSVRFSRYQPRSPQSNQQTYSPVNRQSNKTRRTDALPSQNLAFDMTSNANGLAKELNKIDLGHLSEEERNKVLNVVQRDLEVRVNETERLKRFRSSILRHDREIALKSQTLAESDNCLQCGRRFILLINPRQTCKNCNRPICRRCSEQVVELNGVLCRLCLKETGYRAMRCNWFYDTVIGKFREFGSTTVAKSLFGDKYKQVQNIAEDELAKMLSRYSANSTSADETTFNEQKLTPSSMDQAKDAQVAKLRKKLQTLMQNTLKEYQQLDRDINLTEQQKYWQTGRIGIEFQKAAAVQLRSFNQTLYITTERHRTMQGTSSRNITQYVMTTLEDVVSNIVGHRVKGYDDNVSIASDDDLESVAIAERDGAEERLAQELLEKVLRDRQQSLSNGVTPIVHSLPSIVTENSAPYNTEVEESPDIEVEKISVVEGSPTRMEMKVEFDKNGEFSWLKESADDTRKPVKFDFHIEHVITGTMDSEGKEHFVLSNSGHFGADALANLAKKHEELRRQGSAQGVVIQHQLIIWAAKLEDSGRYFAVARVPAGPKLSALTEREFQLEVQPAPRWPIHPLHSPEFVQPLTPKQDCSIPGSIELTCTVASNPAPRCLFYRNTAPIPVVIMPLLTSEQDKEDISLSSFSGKYTVISSPYREAFASMSVGYLRNLVLRINHPSQTDVATYTCRAWNFNGRVETSFKLTPFELERKISTRGKQADLTERLKETQMSILNSARNVERTAETHGDVLSPVPSLDRKPPISPNRNINMSYQQKVNTLPASKSTVENYNDQQTTGFPKIKIVGPNGSERIPRWPNDVGYDTNMTRETGLNPQANPNTLPSNIIISHEPAHENSRNAYRRNSREPPSPTSSIISETSSVGSSPFVRNQGSRRSTGPKVIIDRRSQTRKARQSLSKLSSQPEDRFN